jgi:hypothetical protein
MHLLLYKHSHAQFSFLFHFIFTIITRIYLQVREKEALYSWNLNQIGFIKLELLLKH